MKEDAQGNEHEERLDLLLAYLADALDEKRRAEVARKIEDDPQWRKDLEEARAAFKALDTWKAPEPPAGLARRTNRLLEKSFSKKDQLRGLRLRRKGFTRAMKISALTAAALLVSLIAIATSISNMQPDEHDTVLLAKRTWTAGAPAAVRVLVRAGSSFAPAAGARARLSLLAGGKEYELASTTTDEAGTIDSTFTVPDIEPGNYEISIETASDSGSDSFRQPVRIERPYSVMLSTDKPLYRPDAKEHERVVHIRALALRKPTLKPYADAPVTIEISDPEGNRIFKHEGTTSEYGLAWCNYSYPGEAALGRYRIKAEIGKLTFERTFRMSRYVLPKFDVALETDRPWYRPADEMKLTATLRYFFGEPVKDARLSLKTGEDIKLHPDDFRETGPGRYEASVRLPETLAGTELDRGDASITLRLAAEDTAGQTVEKSLRRVVTNRPVRIGLVPESGALVNGVENLIYLVLSTPDGQAYPGSFEILLESGEKIASGMADRTGVAQFAFDAKHVLWQTDTVKLSVSVIAPDGSAVEKKAELYTAQRDYDGEGWPVLLRTDRAIYRAGEPLSITALTAGGDDALFLDVVHQGHTVLTKTIPVSKGKGMEIFDIPPEVFGTVEIHLYRLNSEGTWTRDTKIIYVEQPGGLKIRAEMDKDIYRPRDKASVVFRVTDAGGKPAQAALSLSVVDQALLAIAEEHPGLAQVYFAVERELLRPGVEVHGLHSPESLVMAGPRAVPEIIENASFATVDMIPDWRAFFSRLAKRGLLEESSATNWAQTMEYYANNYGVDTDHIRDALQQAGVPREELRLLERTPMLRPQVHRSYLEKIRDVRAFKDNFRDVLAGIAVFTILGLFVTFYTWLIVTKRYVAVALVSVGLFLVVAAIPATMSAGGSAAFAPADIMSEAPSAGMLAQREFAEKEYTFSGWNGAPEYKTRFHASAEEIKSPAKPKPIVREEFPETLFWLPQVITDENGVSHPVEITMADSITTYQMLVSAVSKQGKLGALEKPITVFQPFFADLDLPISLTQHDEITIPVVVHNHLDEEQQVTLSLKTGEGFEIVDEQSKKLTLAGHEVGSTGFRISVTGVGRITLEVAAEGTSASGKTFADAIRKEIPVEPDGLKVEWTASDRLAETVVRSFTIPASAISGSENLILKIYPGTFSQVVEGLESMLQRPYGCFEQTSSSAYPNTLVLDYMRETGRSSPEIEMKARSFIQAGYQKLLTFEVGSGSGAFSLYGQSPASVWLTAYGLMEFADMSRVHDVDPNLLQRTRDWLAARQLPDGSFTMNGGRTAHGQGGGNLKVTAFCAWALAHQEQPAAPGGKCSLHLSEALDFLGKHLDEIKQDGYLCALTACAAVKSLGAKDAFSRELLTHLKSAAVRSDGAAVVPSRGETLAWGRGNVANSEATALAAIAVLEAQNDPQFAEELLTSIVRGKDSYGGWYSTQATTLALKALALSARLPQGQGPLSVDVSVSGRPVTKVLIPESQRDVVHFVSLREHLGEKAGEVTLKLSGEGKPCYQLVGSYYVPWPKRPRPESAPPVTLSVNYDRTTIARGGLVKVTATVTNVTDAVARMVMVDIGVPPGFSPERADLDALVSQQKISRYEVTGRQVILYLPDFQPKAQLDIGFGIRARFLVTAKAGAASAWPYYEPQNAAFEEPAIITVNE